ncbi:hypothetical protein [Oerskovia sp. USHLN155]|uniref:hypothetical protein n=1 Tax=Oerskovia sp. USHLN155 TaxID=3081288 RepID=UPI0030185B4D
MTTLVRAADDDDPLHALAALRDLRHEADRRETLVVRRARSRGISWAAIATILGVSRQAVHKKYGGSRFARS